MFARAFLLILLVPVVEVILFLKISALLGVLNTVAILLLLSAAGVTVLRWQGLQVFVQLQEGLARGIPPGRSLLEGTLLLLAGALLIVPGFLTDAVGLTLLFPPLRRAVGRGLVRHFEGRMTLERPVSKTEPFGDLSGEVPRPAADKPPIIIDLKNDSGPWGPAAS